MDDEIEQIIPPKTTPLLQQLYDEDLEWVRIRSGINEDLLGEVDA